MHKILIRKRLEPSEEGLMVFSEKWPVIHESPCFFYCVREWQLSMVHVAGGGIAGAKKRNIKVKRVHKVGSRFAFESEKEAMKHLVMLKRRQLVHLKRDTLFLEAFLSLEHPESITGDTAHIAGTEKLVREHIKFD